MTQSPTRPVTSGASIPPVAWLLAALAFALRMAFIAAIAGLWKPPAPGTDSEEYDTYAWNLAQGRGYRGMSIDVTDQDHLTAYRPPVTPLIYAATYLAFGHSYPAAHAVDSLMAALTVLLIFRIGDLTLGRRVAWLSAIGFAFYPMALYYNVELLSESTACLLLTSFSLSVIRLHATGSPRWVVATGLSFGLLMLCKPGMLFAIPFLLLAAAWIYRTDLAAWRRLAFAGAIVGAVMAPWVIRNALVFHRLIPFSNLGGQMLLLSYNRLVVEDPDLYGYCIQDSVMPEYAEGLKSPDDEYLRDGASKAFAVEWIRANPDKIPYLVRWRFVRYWMPWGTGGGLMQRLAIYSPYALVLLFFAAGFLPLTRRFLRERDPALVLPCLLMGSLVSALFFFGQHRYRFPTDWILILYASHAATAGLDAIRSGAVRSWRPSPGPAGWISLVVLGVVGALWVVDDRRIEAYRDDVCRARREAVVSAIEAFRTARGRMPATVAELLPEYLPNIQALHCPKHSLGWNRYHLIREADPRVGAAAISYELRPSASPGGRPALIEVDDRHGGRLAPIEIP